MSDNEKGGESIATKPLNYVMVRHMGYSALTRAERVLSTRHRQRFMLENGRRIRAKNARMTEVTFEDVFKSFNKLLDGIRTGHIQVCRPDNLEPFTMAQFVDLGNRLASDFEKDLEINETLLEPLTGDQADDRVWVEKKADTGLLDDKGDEAKPEEEAKAEAEVEEGDEGEGWTEEALLKLNREELNRVATEEYGVEGASELPNKKAVVEAIFASVKE